MAVKRAVFLDKDGTLIDDLPYNADPDRIRMAYGAGAALRQLLDAGFRLFVVSNQSGIARGLIGEGAMDVVRERIALLLQQEGVVLDGFYYCPHWPHGGTPALRHLSHLARTCDCRKPKPGMLLHAAQQHQLTLTDSWMVGDILDDIEAGRRAGCRTVLIDNGNETEWITGPLRQPHRRAQNLPHAARIIMQLAGQS